MTSIAGSTKISDFAEIWTGVNISSQIKIGKNSFIGMGSVVISDVPENKKCFGNPARVFSKK
jgi:acetyltransferase-like isoleucine patch superfamily enzyme